VVKGVLESQTEATPSRSGHTHLRSLEDTLHPSDWSEDYLPYYSFTALTDVNIKDLLWHRTTLQRNKGRQSRADNAGVLVPSFGDGSGTGTGGSVWYRMAFPLERWKADWSVDVYHRSSNWKEMRTLDLTLERAQLQNPRAVVNTTFFYFTDNLVTYFAVTAGALRSPGLQALVESVKAREEALGCILEPIHVPGTTIIEEGSDDLSRGVWSTPLHERADRTVILSEIFAPVPFSPDVGDWACNQAGLTGVPWHHHSWDHPWIAEAVLGRLTVWAPPPEVAAQLLFFLLKC
jgi:hypothetical protein